MEKAKGMDISVYSLEQLIGPLNDIEKKFAPNQLCYGTVVYSIAKSESLGYRLAEGFS